ncbi:MAG: D-2-hydroxyacid dehydrogenase [Pseudodonghicola sp.]
MTPTSLLPPKTDLHILFAHPAYQLQPLFDSYGSGIRTTQVTTREDLVDALPGADVLVVSGLWRNDLLPLTSRLKYLQSISSGTNHYDLEAIRDHGILLASGQGVNRNAVSEHAFGLLLSLTRRLALARDHQAQRLWPGQPMGAAQREQELPGKTMVVVGTGAIGDRIVRLAKAFDMKVIGVRRDPARGRGAADEVHGFRDLKSLIPAADVLVLSCPLTAETRNIVDAEALALMKPEAYLINVARGGCVDEPALIAALEAGRIAGAGLDVTATEPLPGDSRLWSLPNVVLTAHRAGETQRYEANVLDILSRNLDLLWAGNADLVNRIV